MMSIKYKKDLSLRGIGFMYAPKVIMGKMYKPSRCFWNMWVE